MTSCIVVQYLQAKHLKVNLIKYIFGRIWLLKNYPPEDQPLCRKVQIGVTGMGSEGEGGASTPTAACRKVKIQARTSWEVCGFVWGCRYAPSWDVGRLRHRVKMVALSCGSHCWIGAVIHCQGASIYFKGYAISHVFCKLQLAALHCLFVAWLWVVLMML